MLRRKVKISEDSSSLEVFSRRLKTDDSLTFRLNENCGRRSLQRRCNFSNEEVKVRKEGLSVGSGFFFFFLSKSRQRFYH